MTDPTEHDEDVIDVEQHFAQGKHVPHGKRYRIRIDKRYFVVHKHELTGREILELDGKTPEKFILKLKEHGQPVDIGPNEVVDLSARRVERFVTIPREVKEGDTAPGRRQFPVLPDDVAFLDGLRLRWEAVDAGGIKAFVIYQWTLPPGYNVAVADVHVRLTAGYPDTQIDMAYFAPTLARADGRVIPKISAASFDGRNWQMWSRHRAENQWRPGEDNLSTHMSYVRSWLESELHR